MSPTWTEFTPAEQSQLADRIARNLLREGPQTQSQLALRLSHDFASIGHALKRLESSGLAECARTDSGVVLWTYVYGSEAA